jgi:hypothetical protein
MTETDPSLLAPQAPLPEQVAANSYAIETAQGAIQVSATQESTRGDGSVELSGEAFDRSTIDFSGVQEHLAVHQDGQVAGSQFRGDLFPDSQTVVSFLSEVLPPTLQYDQHGRVELTLDVQLPSHESLGYSGVKSIAELEAEGAHIESGVRTPGGEPAEEDGVKGAWYPEMVRDPETGSFVVKKTESGEVANPHGKFGPEASIATVSDTKAAETNKVSIVMQRNAETGRPLVLTAYPGEIAPAYPAKITTEAFSADSLHGKEAEYWSQHAFIKFAGQA